MQVYLRNKTKGKNIKASWLYTHLDSGTTVLYLLLTLQNVNINKYIKINQLNCLKLLSAYLFTDMENNYLPDGPGGPGI